MSESIPPTLLSIIERLKLAKRAAIFTHQRPDPDALGSQVAMAHILKQLGAKDVRAMQFAPPPKQYEFLLKSSGVTSDEWSSEWAGSEGGLIDTIVVVDTCTYSQMEPVTTFLKAERHKIVAIDHHQSRDEIGPLLYSDTKAAACVEILWEIAKAAGLKIDEAMAFPLMAGLVSDTGWFRFDSVTARTHAMAADLTPLVNNALLYEKLMQTETKPKLGLMQRALASMQWSAGDRFACMSLTPHDFSETGATQSQTEYLVDMPLTIQTVEVVALLTEMADGRVRGSLRSKRDVDVNAICRQFGGGGACEGGGVADGWASGGSAGEDYGGSGGGD